MRRLVGGVLVLIALVATGCSGVSLGGDRPQDTGGGFVSSDGNLTRIAPADRKPAPELSGPLLGVDGTISTKAYAGKVIVVNVWGSWCPPCRAEAAGLQAASVKTKDVAQFVGINSRDPNPAPAEAFVRVQKISYPSIYDPNGTQLVKFTDLPPNAIPTTIIIDKGGRVAARALGSVTEITLEDMIDDIAAEQ